MNASLLSKNPVSNSKNNKNSRKKKRELVTESTTLKNQLQLLEQHILEEEEQVQEQRSSDLKVWTREEPKEGKHVAFEIPAGTVVKALLVSGADCSVAVQKPTGP